MALVVLNDADNHRSGMAADHRLASALDVQEVSSRLEDLVRYSMKASPQVEPKALASTWADHVNVPEAGPVDHAEPVMFGLGQHRVDGRLQPLGESLEPGVCRGLQDHAVLRHQDAPRLFPVAVLPALLLDHLDGRAVAGGEGDLVDLSGSLYREAGSPERVLDRGGVAFHLADRAEAEVAEDEDKGLGGEGLVAAGSLHWGSLGLQVALQVGWSGKVVWLSWGGKRGGLGGVVGVGARFMGPFAPNAAVSVLLTSAHLA